MHHAEDLGPYRDDDCEGDFRRLVRAYEAAGGHVTPELLAAGDMRLREIGRNQPCPCGSERKYRRCCGRAS